MANKASFHKCLRPIVLAFAALSVGGASAQYYEIANQLPSLISPALSGSFRYKGYVDLTGTAGMGENRANFVGISTSQGFQYASWFFMGAGLGVDIAMANYDGSWNHRPDYNNTRDFRPRGQQTRVMVPIFSDFRFIIGNGSGQGVAGFIDLKLGSTWVLGNRYLKMETASLSNSAQFLFRPSIGLRVPVSSSDPRQAFNIGVTYQLITSGNNYGWYDDSVTLNSLGASISFEW